MGIDKKKNSKRRKGRRGTDKERQGERGQGIGRERKGWRISSDSEVKKDRGRERKMAKC